MFFEKDASVQWAADSMHGCSNTDLSSHSLYN